ncbi:hypothetical protein KEM54_001218 [Ascosphaera aggregata]|nr:hypothetical protein KEM54_001218 [Ascosphaera aggregata]
MAMRRELSPPGAASYSSKNMHVGDGTWDSGRDTFLLPNLMGLNFDTMRYNGMGNRFKGDHYYKQLIVAHAIFAVVVFLFFIPGAILTSRFFTQSIFWLRIHIGLQLMSLFALTVTFVLGWCAVGNERKLTNPHHGIGLAIYVMFLVQFMWGWFLHRRMKRHTLVKNLLIIFSHRWLGRAVALLGIVQIPLGLCLYGSPLILFILYALAVFVLLVIYSYLNFTEYRRNALVYAAAPGGTVASDSGGGRWHGRYNQSAPSEPDSIAEPPHMHDKRRPNPAYVAGSGASGGGLMMKLFNGRRGTSQAANYEPAPANNYNYDYADPSGRLEEGRPRPHPTATEHTAFTTEPQYDHDEHHLDRGKAAAGALLGGGALAAVTNLMKNRKDKKEQKRVDELRRQDLENERLMRQNMLKGRDSFDDVVNDPRRPQHKAENSISSMSVTTDLKTEFTEPGASEMTDFIAPHQQPVGDIGLIANPKRRTGQTTGVEAGRPQASNSRRRVSGRRDESPDSRSPADVSLHMKIHDGDSRSVTLRRLTPEEVAAARRSKSERKMREERERSQRQPSRSRSRHAVDRRRSKSRPAPGAPQGLNTISEVSSNSNTQSTSTKDTAWLTMEARERYEQEQMDREKRKKGKEAARDDPSVPYNIATSVPPPPVPYHGGPYASPQDEPAAHEQPPYTYDPNYYSHKPEGYQASPYLPHGTSTTYTFPSYKRHGGEEELHDTNEAPAYPDAHPRDRVTMAEQAPPRPSRNGMTLTILGIESDGDENYASRRERRRLERRARERSLSKRRDSEE